MFPYYGLTRIVLRCRTATARAWLRYSRSNCGFGNRGVCRPLCGPSPSCSRRGAIVAHVRLQGHISPASSVRVKSSSFARTLPSTRSASPVFQQFCKRTDMSPFASIFWRTKAAISDSSPSHIARTEFRWRVVLGIVRTGSLRRASSDVRLPLGAFDVLRVRIAGWLALRWVESGASRFSSPRSPTPG